MNARQVLVWVKANVFIVVFSVLMIAALVALPIVSGKMNASVRDRVQERVSKQREVERYEEYDVSLQLPDGTQENWSTTVNDALIAQYRDYVEAERSDADAIVAEAVAFNSKDRQTVMPDLFPTPRGQVEVLPRRYWERLADTGGGAYDQLLDRVGAGSPPSGEEPAERLQRQRRFYITERIQKSEGDTLTAKEQEELRDYLAGIRLGIYSDAADRISFYLERSQLPVPAWNQAANYLQDLDLLFRWQWDFWVVEDVLEAIADANADAGSVRVAPVKRILSLGIGEVLAPAGPAVPGGGNNPGFGGSRGGEPTGPVLPTTPPDASRELPRDWTSSVTGRTSNDLYDVRMVQLNVVAETARLPELFDALARRNFITIVDADVLPADSYSAVSAGYYYGAEPVSEVRLLLETIWLREWTREFMPDATRGRLGVYRPDPSAAAGSDGATSG